MVAVNSWIIDQHAPRRDPRTRETVADQSCKSGSVHPVVSAPEIAPVLAAKIRDWESFGDANDDRWWDGDNEWKNRER